jgi:hypothetical protein
MKMKSIQVHGNYFLLSLLERNGDYEYERVGLIKAAKNEKKVAERVAEKWYDGKSQPDSHGFAFDQGCVSVCVGDVKRVGKTDAKVLLRHLPLWK